MNQEDLKPKPTISYASIEATLRGAGVLDNSEVLRVLKAEAGFDIRRPKASYDWSLVKVQERIVPEVLGWQGTHNEKMFRLGCCTFEGWGETILGKVLTAPIGRATSARALELMARNMSLNPAFGKHELRKLGPASYIFVAKNDPREPEFVAGLMVPVLNKTGAIQVEWKVKHTDFEAYEISFKWDNPAE